MGNEWEREGRTENRAREVGRELGVSPQSPLGVEEETGMPGREDWQAARHKGRGRRGKHQVPGVSKRHS